MKFFHTADWHIGKTVNEHSMLEDQRYYLKQLVRLLKDEKADALIIAGDLYDRSVPSADAVALVDEIFTEIIIGLRIPILAIAGNHDGRQRLSFASRLLEKQGLHLVGNLSEKVERVTLQDENGPVHFILLPYFQPADLRALYPGFPLHTHEECYNFVLERLVKNLGKFERNVLVSHGFLAASELLEENVTLSGSELSVGGSDFVRTPYFKEFDYVALGHLHAPQTAGLTTARYSGSLLKYSTDETSQKKLVYAVELSELGQIKITDYQIKPLHDLRVIHGNFRDILRTAEESDLFTDDYIYAELTQNEPELDAMAKLRAVYPNALGLRYLRQAAENNVRNKNLEQIRRESPIQIFCDFYREITGETLDESKAALAEKVFQEIADEERSR